MIDSRGAPFIENTRTYDSAKPPAAIVPSSEKSTHWRLSDSILLA